MRAGVDVVRRQMGIDVVAVNMVNDHAVTRAEVTLNFWRMANSRDDKTYLLQEHEAGEYVAEVLLPDSGRWVAEILIKQGDKRYRRQDAIGTPYCITIDHQTLEDNTVTIRDRDTMKQERVAISEVKSIIQDSVSMAALLKRI